MQELIKVIYDFLTVYLLCISGVLNTNVLGNLETCSLVRAAVRGNSFSDIPTGYYFCENHVTRETHNIR